MYHIVEIDMEVVTNDVAGYGTALTYAPKTLTPTYATRTYKFTDAPHVIPQSGVLKCISSVIIKTPVLKAGLGMASRATATIGLTYFVDDPNKDAPAVIADSGTITRGSYFGKFSFRYIIANRVIRVKEYTDDDVLMQEYSFIGDKLTNSGSGKWSLTAKDVLFRTDLKKSQYPALVTGTLQTDITQTTTSITVLETDFADWDKNKHVAIIADEEICAISNIVDNGNNSITLTVIRGGTINVNGRIYKNTNQAASSGDDVFRGRYFSNAKIEDVIFDVFTDAGITTANYNPTNISTELDTWLGLNYRINCIFYESNDTSDVLDTICKEFMLDIFTDDSGQIQVSSTSQWKTPVTTFTEGREIVYKTQKVKTDEDARYSRSLFQYNKDDITQDKSYRKSSLVFDPTYETSHFYDEVKVKKLAKSIILGNQTYDTELVEATNTRFINRFSAPPKTYSGIMTARARALVSLGDVIYIQSDEVQGADGSTNLLRKAQLINIAPTKDVGRYSYQAMTYDLTDINPDGGFVFNIVNTVDLNLYSIAGNPPVNSQLSEYVYIFDGGDYGQLYNLQTITSGTGWRTTGGTVTLNIVCINGANISSTGGNGGDSNRDGGNAGDVLLVETQVASNVIINVWTNGSRTIAGTVYTCDGYFRAGGGGGSGGDNVVFELPQETAIAVGGGGGGGAGVSGGNGGLSKGSPYLGSDGTDGTNQTNGTGGFGGFVFGEGSAENGGDGGYFGVDGGDSITKTGGLAGKTIINNGAAVNVYTSGDATRFVVGHGDAKSGGD